MTVNERWNMKNRDKRKEHQRKYRKTWKGRFARWKIRVSKRVDLSLEEYIMLRSRPCSVCSSDDNVNLYTPDHVYRYSNTTVFCLVHRGHIEAKRRLEAKWRKNEGS